VSGLDGTDTASADVGARLRRMRLALGLSLADVAVRAEVTKGFLSQLERGLSGVAVPTLLRICDAMGVSIGSVFEYPEQTVVQGGVPLQMGGVGLREYLLTPRGERTVQVMRTVMKPGGGSGGAYSLRATTIFVIVLRGALELTVDGELRSLGVGDSTTFPATAMHDWRNSASEEAEVLWVIAPPLAPEDFPGQQ
jgi:transcriptional regulator with XRE-family HTH domain